jgi:hypothetical protein
MRRKHPTLQLGFERNGGGAMSVASLTAAQMGSPLFCVLAAQKCYAITMQGHNINNPGHPPSSSLSLPNSATRFAAAAAGLPLPLPPAKAKPPSCLVLTPLPLPRLSAIRGAACC